MTDSVRALRQALEAAELALTDLGACDDPSCRELNCVHALLKVRAARAEEEPRRDHLVTVVQRLVGAVANLRARFPGGEPATPVEEALDVVDVATVELERLVRWPGQPAHAPGASPKGDAA